MSSTAKLLVVDDEPINRELLQVTLAPLDCTIQTAESGEEALEAMKTFAADVVLLDVMMPGMTGFEVCRQIRQNPALRDVTVIMITALDDRQSKITGLEAGADEFLSKPIDRMELLTRLN